MENHSRSNGEGRQNPELEELDFNAIKEQWRSLQERKKELEIEELNVKCNMLELLQRQCDLIKSKLQQLPPCPLEETRNEISRSLRLFECALQPVLQDFYCSNDMTML